MSKALWLLAVFALTGCMAGQQAGSSSPGSCRLPISIADSTGQLQGAFLDYPSGKVSIDQAGSGGASYDRRYYRWLPVPRNAVSADGTLYAYLDRKVPGTPGLARLHIVYVLNGNEKVVEVGQDGSSFVVVDFAPEGIWLTYSGYENPSGGLLLQDAKTAEFKDVGGSGIFQVVAGTPGVFWFTDGGLNPQPSAGMGSIIQARMQRLTVLDGKRETWFTEPGKDLRVLGTDLAGNPIFTDGDVIRIASSPSDAKVIDLPLGNYQVIADSHGVWFGGADGIYLYSESSGVKKVSSQAGSPANSCG